MIQNLRQLSILNKIFYVKNNEWQKISMAWVVRFLYRICFVIGWTIIVAMFVSRYGILSLPYLFIINAVFSIIGSIFYSTFLDRFKVLSIMVATIFVAAFCLFLAYYFTNINSELFFAFLLVAESFLLVQLRINLYGYVEKKFTPIQSERTFPLIEASDTIGGIVAGLLIVYFSNIIDVSSFVLIWAGILLLIVPILYICESVSRNIPSINIENDESEDFIIKIKKIFNNSKHISYILGLVIIVFLQWFLFNLLEFQYTKTVYSNVSNFVFDAGSGFEHSFVHDLGELFILFSCSALIVQLFIGGRLISSLGVFGSMILHPLLTFFSIFGLTLFNNFNGMVFLKNNFTVTSVIQNNAYHSAYYAIKENLRDYIREFLDGIIRPIGALIGTLLLIFIQKFYSSSSQSLLINVAMISVVVFMFFTIYLQQNKYTNVVLDCVKNCKNKKERINAIDILAQKGHKKYLGTFTHILLNEKEPISIRVRILRAYTELQDIRAVGSILKSLESSSYTIRNESLDTLLNFRVLQKESGKHLVIEHELIDKLQNLFKRENNDDIRSKILILLSKISTITTFNFLLKLLKESNGKIKAVVINALGNCKDEAVLKYIKPYIKSDNRDQRLSAVIALGRFKISRKKAEEILRAMLESENYEEISDAVFIIGEINMKSKRKFCQRLLNSNNNNLRMQSAIALAKMGYYESIPVLIDMLFNSSSDVSIKLKNILKNVDVRISKNLDKIIKSLVAEKINIILDKNKESLDEEFTNSDLKTLEWLYCLAEEHEEMEAINNLNKI